MTSPASPDDPNAPADRVEFYWRPGCGFCMMLDRSLTKAGVPFEKHNIWDEPAHAEVVRRHARGNETVPTVVIGDVGLVNPSADEVIGVLSVKAPHLVPDGWEPPQPGRIAATARRLLGG
jgi:glutaredoxin